MEWAFRWSMPLSEWLEAEVHQNGKIHRQRYARGVPEKAVEALNKKTDKRGTIVRFKADSGIFTTTSYKYKPLRQRLEEMAFLNKGLSLVLSDERAKSKVVDRFCYQGGIQEMVGSLCAKKQLLHKKIIYFESQKEEVMGEFALAYTTNQSEEVLCFSNGINNSLGGTHLEGFRTALTRTLNEYLKKPENENFKRKLGNSTISGEDVREGLVAVISVKLPEPQFNSQTKEKLVNAEVKGLVQQMLGERLSLYFEENPGALKAHSREMYTFLQGKGSGSEGAGTHHQAQGISGGRRAPG